MRLLFITDIHGHFEALPHLPEADLVLCGGDFTNFGTSEEFQSAVKLVEVRFPKFYAVAGNLDPGETADAILAESGHLLSPTPIQVSGLTLVGVSGSHTCPRPTPYEWADEAMEERLTALTLPAIDILVTHAPPYGFGADVIPNGMQVGSHAIRKFAERLQPRLHLCGHIHEASGVFDENGTVLVNSGAFGAEGHYACIDLQIHEKPNVALRKAAE